MPWAAAIALGAIVAPPDAATATAVLCQVSLPHRIVGTFGVWVLAHRLGLSGILTIVAYAAV
jgi:NhaP-type Na+/H+ or K+/H+ antiporter